MSTRPLPLKDRVLQNTSRTVVEGLDKPIPKPQLKDRIKIDPTTQGYVNNRFSDRQVKGA